jgi:hypothetical protein
LETVSGASEDKMIDPLAIALAMKGGQRKIRLTSAEQAIAVRVMLAQGDSADAVAATLGIPVDQIRRELAA